MEKIENEENVIEVIELLEFEVMELEYVDEEEKENICKSLLDYEQLGIFDLVDFGGILVKEFECIIKFVFFFF